MSEPLVLDSFDVPARFETPSFVLEPLGPEHNESDHAAWSSSIEHIRATPGFVGRRWPRPMTSAENLADLEAHRTDFDARTAFAYTVLDPRLTTCSGACTSIPTRRVARTSRFGRGYEPRMQTSTVPCAMR